MYLDKDIDIKKFEIEKIGPFFENHKAFPERINTEFIQVVDRKNLNMRVWERGSGETLACGTGACASLVATVLNGMCDIDATLHLLGGDLNISWDTESGNVYMEGPATTVVFPFRISRISSSPSPLKVLEKITSYPQLL